MIHLFFLSAALGQALCDDGEYRLRPEWDYPLLGVGIAAATTGYLKERDVAGSRFDPGNLDRKDIPAYDRWAIGYYSKPMATLSDALIVAVGLLPAIATGIDLRAGDESQAGAWRDLVLYGEVVAYASAISLYSKALELHPRPLAFTDHAPESERTSGDARSAFFSEHTTGAFAAAAFAGYTFQSRHPDSHWVPVIWTGALGTAAAVGILRVTSGKHFPSDVLAGAAAGALIGYAVPRLHASCPKARLGPVSRQSARILSRTEFLLAPSPGGGAPQLMIRIHG